MSGDVQPRKRKDKRRKKDDEEIHTTSGSDEIIHIQKDSRLGGNICAKIVFFCLLGALGVMIGLIITEYRGSNDVETQLPVDSPWSQMLEGWVDESADHHDEPDSHVLDHDHGAEIMKEYEAQIEEEEEEEDEEEEMPKVIEEEEEEEEQDVGDKDEEKVESEAKPGEVTGAEAEGQGEEEDETSGGEESVEQAHGESNVSGEPAAEVPDLSRRQTLIPPTVEPPVTSPPVDQHVTEEYEYSEQEYEDEEEEEEDEKRVIETLEDLKAKYQQMTPEDSDAEPAEEDFAAKPTYTPTPPESEPEEEQSEAEEEEEEEEEEDDPLAQWKSVRGREMLAEEVEEVQTGSESEEEEPPPVPPTRRGGPRSSDEPGLSNELGSIDEPVIEEQVYVNADITNAEDWEIREDLDLADAELNNGKPEIALNMFSAILTQHPRSPRAYYGKAQALDQLAEAKRSNQLLMSAINTYLEAIELPSIPDKLFLRLANRTVDRMRFKGLHMQAVPVHHKLISRFHDNPWHRNQLAVNYMMINRLADAELVLEQTRQRWPADGLTQAHYGLVLKLQGRHAESIPLLKAGINSQAKGTTDSHFYFHLGDALSRQNKTEEAMQVYAQGVEKGLFRSVYQRSLYNVDRLKAQPWWTIEETTYAPFFKKLEENWKVIRDEGLSALKAQIGFQDEAESLRDTGNWKQFELFARGQKYNKNCERTPITCRLIEDFPPASGCRRGQTKFSVMEGGTHVWPHCGPTNCRLRAHLGLVVPNGTAIRVAEETRNWAEGKVFIFDDSFEHEVWHRGTEKRLVLIVDVWHPELTSNERATLTTI